MNLNLHIAAALLLAVARTCNAQSETFTLTNVDFEDGSIATGNFTYNFTSQSFTAWDIVTTQTVNPAELGFNPLPGTTYTNLNSTSPASLTVDPSALEFILSSNSQDHIGLVFSTPLTTAGGTVPLSTAFRGAAGSEESGFNTRSILSGSVTAVPLPASGVLMLSGLAALVLIAWRRREGLWHQA